MTVRVLVADDQSLVRAGFRMLLADEEDLEVVGEASNGLEAVEKATRLRPDVILMDYWMPRMNGLLAAEVLGVTPETSHIPVLCITALDLKPDRAQAAGCRELLYKPLRTHELVQAVRRYMPSETGANKAANVEGD